MNNVRRNPWLAFSAEPWHFDFGPTRPSWEETVLWLQKRSQALLMASEGIPEEYVSAMLDSYDPSLFSEEQLAALKDNLVLAS